MPEETKPVAAAPVVGPPIKEPPPPTAAPTVPAVPAPEEPASTGWAAVKQQEQVLRAERDRLKVDQTALETAKSDHAAIMEEIKGDPMGFLEKNGVDFRTLATEHVATDDTTRQIQKVNTETEQLRADLVKVQEQLKQQGGEATRTQGRASFEQTLQDDKYALLRTHPGAVDEWEKLQVAYAQVYPNPLTNDQAAEMLQKQYGEMLKSAASHQAVQEVLGISASQDPAVNPPPGPVSPPQATNPPTSVSGTQTLPSPPGQTTKVTREELAKRVAAKLPSNFMSSVLG